MPVRFPSQLRAHQVLSSWLPAGSASAPSSAAYTITLAGSGPGFSPVGGTYSSAQTVAISTTTPSATIYYTTNGATPTTSSSVYAGPVSVAATETLRAIAMASGGSASPVNSAAYTIALRQRRRSSALRAERTPQPRRLPSAQPRRRQPSTTPPMERHQPQFSAYTGPITSRQPRHLMPSRLGNQNSHRCRYGDSASSVSSADYTITPAAAHRPSPRRWDVLLRTNSHYQHSDPVDDDLLHHQWIDADHQFAMYAVPITV